MGNGFREMVLFELRFRAKSVIPYIFFAVLFFLAMLVMSVDTGLVSNRDGRSFLNSPESLNVIAVALVALCATMISALAGTAIYRDFESNTHELFFSTRLSKADYWYGRFVGSFLVTVIVFSAIPLGFLAGCGLRWEHKEIIGPYHLDTYLALWGHYLLPDLFLISVLFFVGGALTRSLLAIYTQGIVLLALWLGSVVLINSLEKRMLAGVLEPFGLSAMANVTRYWTLSEENTRLVPLTEGLLINRLLWVGVALVVLIGGYYAFDFAHSPRTLRKAATSDAPPTATNSLDVFAGDVPPAVPTGWRYHVATFLSLLHFYTLDTLRSVPFLVIAMAGVGVLLIAASEADKVFDTPVYPVTRIILASVTAAFRVFFFALITFYVGELVWRERVVRADQTTDVLPVASATALLAKLGAVLLMIITLDLVLVIAGVGVQLFKGYTRLELPLYFFWLYGVEFWDLTIVALLCFFLHTLINQKFVAHLALVLIYIVGATFRSWGLERRLYLVGSHGDFVYSDMNGFGAFLGPIRWWQLYWIAAGVLLACLTLKLWARGTDSRLWVRGGSSRIGTGTVCAALLAGAVFVGSGVFLYYNTDVLNEYTTAWETNERSARYEKHYKKRYEHEPQPKIVGVVLDVTLHPRRGTYRVRGTYRLKNKTAKPVREILVNYNTHLFVNRWDWSMPVKVGITEKKIGFQTFKLVKPLALGAEILFTFDLEDKRRGFSNNGKQSDIAENGTFLTAPAPRIGYQEESEISDKSERRHHHLGARRVMAPVTDISARQVTYIGNDADWISFEATVRTDPDQTALAPGYLVREWNENGQKCFRYRMDAPIRNFYSILSARYAVKRDTWTGPDGKKVALSVYYHPAHAYNVSRMLAGVKGSLDYCSRNYAPYQFRQLRVLEFPDYAKFAQSFPNTIPYSEGIGFIARVDDLSGDIDYPYYVSAHETAHQWWAHQVIGGNVEGSEMLSESLSEYSALMVFRQKYGARHLRHFLRYDLDEYLSGRKGDDEGENPLVKAQHQQYIHYRKGSLVFYALAERIGEARLNAILSRYLKDKRFQEPPYTTAPELVEYLKQGATRPEREFIRDLFEKITIYECRADTATRKKLPGGKWRVTLRYSVAKFYADKKGKETPAPLNGESFDVNVFDKSAKSKGKVEELGDPLMPNITVTATTKNPARPRPVTGKIIFTVPSKPYEAGIDPYNLMIDRTPDNNLIEVRDE